MLERLFEKQNRKLFLVLEVLEQSGDLELVGRDSSLNANKIVGQPFLKIVEESSRSMVHPDPLSPENSSQSPSTRLRTNGGS